MAWAVPIHLPRQLPVIDVNWSSPGQNSHHLADAIVKCIFMNEKKIYFDWYFHYLDQWQGLILTFNATCPVGQVRLTIHLSCMKWHLSTQLYMLLSSDYWPVLSDKCHYNATCPRSNFSKFLPVRDGPTKLKVEPWMVTVKVQFRGPKLLPWWLFFSKVLWYSSEVNFIGRSQSSEYVAKLHIWNNIHISHGTMS